MINKYKNEREEKIGGIDDGLNTTPQRQYENILRYYESFIRNNTKSIYQLRLQKDVLENRIDEYMEIEEEFEEMKSKFKYEDGKFLENDRKDNEILIIRAENTNLKKSIKELEGENLRKKEEIKRLVKEVEELKEEIEKNKSELTALKDKYENDILKTSTIQNNNINITNNNKINFNNKNIIKSDAKSSAEIFDNDLDIDEIYSSINKKK